MNAGAAPLLRFDSVACLRGGRLLFTGISFAIEPGSALTIGGPNGVGKSSLLRIAAGLLRPYAGRIERTSPAGLSDEGTALDERLPLRRALAFWAALDQGDPDAGLAALGIAHLAEVPVRLLSTGQRKRATLARVVASGAPLWLLDEPANGLDTEGLASLANAIEHHRARGGAVIAATHQPLGMTDAETVSLEAAC